MGKKIVGLYCVLCLLSFALISCSCFTKWYQQVFKTFGFKTALKLEVSLLTAHIPGDSIMFCRTIRYFKSITPNRCLDIKEPTPLQDLAADWCAPLIFQVWPVPCQAFNTAYIMGLVVMIVYGLNIIFLCTCFYLLYYYVDSKNHKAIYRTWAMVLHAIGTGILIISCIMYTILAMKRLNDLGGTGIPGFFEASQSVGMTPGFFIVWVGIVCQLVALGLHGCIQVSGEETEEQRLYKEMLKEQQQYGAIEAQMGVAAGGAGSGYFPQDPYAQQQQQQQPQYDASAYPQPQPQPVYDASAYPQPGYSVPMAPVPAPMPEYAGGPHFAGPQQGEVQGEVPGGVQAGLPAW